MYISDMLSRAYLPDTGNQSEIEHVNMVQCLPIRPERLQQLKTETESDEALQLLKTVIRGGWREEKQDLPILITPYHSIRVVDTRWNHLQRRTCSCSHQFTD